MDYELSAWILTAVLLSAALVLLAVKGLRRPKRKPSRPVDRISSRPRGRCVPKEKAPEAVLPFYDVERPGAWVFEEKGRAVLILQRAQGNDEPHFEASGVSPDVLAPLAPLFARAPSLQRIGEEALSRDLYTVNLVGLPAAETRLRVVALSAKGVPMGDPCRETVPSDLISTVSEIANVLNQTNIFDRAIEAADKALRESWKRIQTELDEENRSLWRQRLDQVRSATSEEGEARFLKTEEIFGWIDSLTRTIRSRHAEESRPDECLSIFAQWELALRTLSLQTVLTVSRTKEYGVSLQQMSRVVEEVREYRLAIEAASDRPEIESRLLSDEALNGATQVEKLGIARLAGEKLLDDALRLQLLIDEALIHREKRPRLAVRLRDDATAAALLQLHAY